MSYILIGLAILFILVFLALSIKIIRPTERAVVETFGKYSRFLEPGFTMIIPFAQKVFKVETTERMSGIEPQEIITNDNLNAKVDLVVYYKVKKDEDSVKRSIYEINNFVEQIIVLAQTTARNVVGGMNFRVVNSERNELNKKLAEIMRKETEDWGVDVVRVELKEITPPDSVQETMNKVIQASNEKQSAVDFATAVETQADGERRAAIKKAEGKKQASILEAEGQTQAFELINKAFTGNAQLLKKLEVTQASLEDNAKIVITKEGINPQIILGNIPTEVTSSK